MSAASSIALSVRRQSPGGGTVRTGDVCIATRTPTMGVRRRRRRRRRRAPRVSACVRPLFGPSHSHECLAALAVSHTRDSVHDEDGSPSAAPPNGRVLRRRRRRHRSSRVRRVFGRGWLLVTLTRVCTTRTGVLRRRRPRAPAAAAAEPSLSHTMCWREFWTCLEDEDDGELRRRRARRTYTTVKEPFFLLSHSIFSRRRINR